MTDHDLEALASFRSEYLSWMNRRVFGIQDIVDKVLVAFLSEGSILLEGPPGLGKTSLVKAVSGFMGLSSGRIQFTPDLMPLDVIGTSIFTQDAETGKPFTFYPGPIFANIVIGDEINRATPKTQSAFLEAMEEKRITFLGTTYALPSPFLVMATQNPIELEGTYPLPEAQIDRFFMKLEFSYPGFADMKRIISEEKPIGGDSCTAEETADVFAAKDRLLKEISVVDEILDFITMLVTHSHSGNSNSNQVRKYVRYGASPRAAIALLKSAKVNAILDGRIHVSFDDVEKFAREILEHRLILNFEAETNGIRTREVVESLIDSVKRDFGRLR